MKKLQTILIDNYDSFTYNLFQYLQELGANTKVFKNDKINVAQIKKMNPTHIVISPGPGAPAIKKYFGVCKNVIKTFYKKIPILGVCLGHQGIIHAFGGKIVKAPYPMHGKTSAMKIYPANNCVFPSIFGRMPKKIKVMRYHSLIGKRNTVPKDFAITCGTVKDNLVMGIQHKKYPLYGIQFHPESIGTPYGKHILSNFLDIATKVSVLR